ncbi:hypothetical protein EVAR_65520_1 [Eumeta japonica]|uniref:Uncharacterized protein n=1 Tax=Eumeta variegata TaxID=151549 RepID=A0A4C1ZKI8_EUMVA|nr:hypothetical protein EVAR_65520_1 [Eumeta japonica]
MNTKPIKMPENRARSAYSFFFIIEELGIDQKTGLIHLKKAGCIKKHDAWTQSRFEINFKAEIQNVNERIEDLLRLFGRIQRRGVVFCCLPCRGSNHRTVGTYPLTIYIFSIKKFGLPCRLTAGRKLLTAVVTKEIATAEAGSLTSERAAFLKPNTERPNTMRVAKVNQFRSLSLIPSTDSFATVVGPLLQRPAAPCA